MRITILNFDGSGIESVVEHLSLSTLLSGHEINELKINNLYSNECFNALKAIEIYNQNYERGGGQ